MRHTVHIFRDGAATALCGATERPPLHPAVGDVAEQCVECFARSVREDAAAAHGDAIAALVADGLTEAEAWRLLECAGGDAALAVQVWQDRPDHSDLVEGACREARIEVVNRRSAGPAVRLERVTLHHCAWCSAPFAGAEALQAHVEREHPAELEAYRSAWERAQAGDDTGMAGVIRRLVRGLGGEAAR